MSVHLRELLMRELPALRYEPIEKHIRGVLAGETVIDSTRALLVWEPLRVVPSYAVPVDDVHADLAPAPVPPDPGAGSAGVPPIGPVPPQLLGRSVLDPSIPFAVHSTEGEPLLLRARGGREAQAFRPADPAFAHHVVVDFTGVDEWYEEDERNVSHPRDPFHRVDILHSSRQVRIEVDGETLAESSRPCLLFEAPLPVRYYLPRDDVRTELLEASARRTFCAYKGEASYWSTASHDDVAWTYREPLREAAEVTGRIAFFNELVDVMVDGQRLERPITPWSRA